MPQNDNQPTVVIEDEDVDFTISDITDGVEINANDDDVTFVQQMPQHPRDGLARMLQDKTPRTEVDAWVLEVYPSFTANIALNETDKDKKQKEIFDKIINQLLPGNDTIYIDHDEKSKTYKVKQETSDKDVQFILQ